MARGGKRRQNRENSDDDEEDPKNQHHQAESMGTILDRGTVKDSKLCAHCRRPFTWRKKWERCWDEVQTCSNACKRERKLQLQRESKGDDAREGAVSGGEELVDSDAEALRAKPVSGTHISSKDQEGDRAKVCDVCGERVQLAYRCRWDATKIWRFVCRPCWPKISQQNYLEMRNLGAADALVAVDGAEVLKGLVAGNPHYVYGGTWKSTIGLSKKEMLQDLHRREKKKAQPRSVAPQSVVEGGVEPRETDATAHVQPPVH